ncbi:hypothetical protein AAC387_Pa10g0433 [Persea americana]
MMTKEMKFNEEEGVQRCSEKRMDKRENEEEEEEEEEEKRLGDPLLQLNQRRKMDVDATPSLSPSPPFSPSLFLSPPFPSLVAGPSSKSLLPLLQEAPNPETIEHVLWAIYALSASAYAKTASALSSSPSAAGFLPQLAELMRQGGSVRGMKVGCDGDRGRRWVLGVLIGWEKADGGEMVVLGMDGWEDDEGERDGFCSCVRRASGRDGGQDDDGGEMVVLCRETMERMKWG